MIAAASASSAAMPASSRGLVNGPTDRSEVRSVRAANAVPIRGGFAHYLSRGAGGLFQACQERTGIQLQAFAGTPV